MEEFDEIVKNWGRSKSNNEILRIILADYVKTNGFYDPINIKDLGLEVDGYGITEIVVNNEFSIHMKGINENGTCTFSGSNWIPDNYLIKIINLIWKRYIYIPKVS